MEALEALQKSIKAIAARTHGQKGDVRTFQGRQLIWLKDSTHLQLLPSLESDTLQVLSGGDFGKWYTMVDVDPVNGSNDIIGA